MVSGHTRGVRPKYVATQSIISFKQGTEDMQQIRTVILIVYQENHIELSLHCLAAVDINPIVKTIVTGEGQRLCSTTFYQ